MISYAQLGKPMQIDGDSAPTSASDNASDDEDGTAPRPYRCLSILLMELEARESRAHHSGYYRHLPSVTQVSHARLNTI
jgi:hypothetical protein